MLNSKILYTARVHTRGNRAGGTSRSDDGRLDISHALPGTPGAGTNPEQLFAAGWSACFAGAIGIAAGRQKITLPSAMAIDAEVDLCQSGEDFFLQARLDVSLPGLDKATAKALVDAAHQTCPYSKAMRGNVDVVLNVV